MCDFVSWKTYKGKLYFLTNDIVKLRLKEFKQYNRNWERDLLGHGAIDWFFNLPENCGVKRECTNFSNPKNFPDEIVLAMKECRMSLIGFNSTLLNQPARKEYNKIEQTAQKEYNKIEQTAWEEYERIKQTAWKEYNKIEQTTFQKLFSNPENRAEAWK